MFSDRVHAQGSVRSRNTKDGRPYRVTELFSGIGAQRMALIEEGIPHEVVGTSEIDRFALQSYEAIYGDNPNLGDITQLEGIPESDILTYSWPCQSVSAANPNAGGFVKGSGTKSSLLWEVQRLLENASAEGTLPEWLVMENVPAVFSQKNRPVFDQWLAFLDSLGYTSEYGTLNARDFGVPQNRNRAYMISHLGDYCPPLPVGNDSGKVLRDILEDEVPERYYLSKARLKGLETSNEKERAAGNGFRFSPKTPEDIASTVTTPARSRKTDNFIYDDRCHQIGTADGISGFDCLKRVYGTDGLSPTIVTGTSGNSMPKISEDGRRIRKLTPRETWRLQGFPDWAFDRAKESGVSDTQLYHQSGNSIAVPVMGAIMRTIDDYEVAESEGRLPRRPRRVTLEEWGDSR